MRSGVVVLLAVVLLLAAACGKEGKSETLSFYEHDTQSANLTFGRKGTNPGDNFVFSGDVFDHKGGTKLGRLGGNCLTAGTKGHGDQFCTYAFTLAGGQIEIEQLSVSDELFAGKTVPIAIIGGTGIYRNARGDGTVQVPTDVPNQADANFVLHLSGVTR